MAGETIVCEYQTEDAFLKDSESLRGAGWEMRQVESSYLRSHGGWARVMQVTRIRRRRVYRVTYVK